MLLLLCSVALVSGEVCNNQCNNKTGEWCHSWRAQDNKVLQCADYASGGKRCMTECSAGGEDYSWCKIGSTWDYCSSEGVTTRGEECRGACTLHSDVTKQYMWCSTGNNEWGYCSNTSMVQSVHYSVNGQECGGECAQAGEEYWWCYKPQRWLGKYSDPDWDYCSPSQDRTRYNAECLDECATRGSDNFWCNIAGDSWDYCSPATPATPPKTVVGGKCSGVCDYFSSSSLWCTRFITGSEDYWDYCGSGTSKQLPLAAWNIIAITIVMFKVM